MEKEWDLIIAPDRPMFNLDIKSVLKYKDLLILFVKRDFAAQYKQTILGPLWFFLQPILTTITFTVVFGNIANLPTSGYPKVLFYLSGITIWNYFSECLTKTSNTFIANANLFSKVYFPRIIVPLSVIVSNLVRSSIQILLLIIFMIYYNITGLSVIPNVYILLFPFLFLLMAGLGLGFGILISSVTTKYRDFQFLVAFSVSLLMYLSPVIFPLQSITNATLKKLIMANPMSSVIETFRYGLLGSSQEFNLWGPLLYTTVFTAVVLLISMSLFNRVQKSFMDTV